jgi:hypothetical protein
MPFQLVYVGPGLDPLPVNDGVYESGAQAGALARELALAPEYVALGYTKVQPRPVRSEDDEAWQEREAARFATGEYERTCWHFCGWFHDNPATRLHFMHLSKKKPGHVTYTADADKGRADLQAPPMRPGRYLESFYSDVLDDGERHYWTQRFLEEHGGATDRLHVTQDADAIEYVYTHGPHSCMASRASDYRSSVHPTRVYAGPDLGVAFILSDDGNESEVSEEPDMWSFRIAARCVVWPDKKRYGRIYGDGGARQNRLAALLEADGYQHSGNFDGARLRRIEDDLGRGLVCPYLDVGSSVGDDGKYLIIGEGGYSADSQSGLIESSGYACPRCGDFTDEEDTIYIHSEEEAWCSECASNSAFYCDGTEEYFANRSSSAYEMQHGETWSRDYYVDNGFECAECEEYVRDSHNAGENESDDPVCERCARNMHMWSDGKWHDEEEPEDDESDDDESNSHHCDSPDQPVQGPPTWPEAGVDEVFAARGILTLAEQSACIGRGPCGCPNGECRAAMAMRAAPVESGVDEPFISHGVRTCAEQSACVTRGSCPCWNTEGAPCEAAREMRERESAPVQGPPCCRPVPAELAPESAYDDHRRFESAMARAALSYLQGN